LKLFGTLELCRANDAKDIAREHQDTSFLETEVRKKIERVMERA
jgi:hypothetical protein